MYIYMIIMTQLYGCICIYMQICVHICIYIYKSKMTIGLKHDILNYTKN